MRLVVSYGCHSVVCVSVRPFVCLCFAHIGEPCQHCWIDRDTIWRTDTIEHKGTMYRGVHIGATYRIRVNDSCAAAMRPPVRHYFDNSLFEFVVVEIHIAMNWVCSVFYAFSFDCVGLYPSKMCYIFFPYIEACWTVWNSQKTFRSLKFITDDTVRRTTVLCDSR